MSEQVVRCLDLVWSSIEELCSDLTAADWRKPTDCPGWTVQDQVAHLCGIESRLLGREQPPPLTSPPAHVRNPLGASNEAQVAERRGLAPEEVLAEFMELTAERLKVISEHTPAELDAEVQGVFGPAPLRDVLAIRVVDCFYHEQDIRRAVGRDGNLDGEVPAFVFGRMHAALPMIVAKRAGVPDGATVVFDVTGPVGGVAAVEVRDGRGAFLPEPPAEPTTTMRMDLETFLCAAGGRWSFEDLSKRIVVVGNATIANAVLANINFLP